MSTRPSCRQPGRQLNRSDLGANGTGTWAPTEQVVPSYLVSLLFLCLKGNQWVARLAGEPNAQATDRRRRRQISSSVCHTVGGYLCPRFTVDALVLPEPLFQVAEYRSVGNLPAARRVDAHHRRHGTTRARARSSYGQKAAVQKFARHETGGLVLDASTIAERRVRNANKWRGSSRPYPGASRGVKAGPKSSGPSMASKSASRVRARCTRLLIVPTAHPHRAAASS
jgi:hypothetical protein